MRQIIYILLFSSVILFNASCSNKDSSSIAAEQLELLDTRAQVSKVYTDLPEESGWTVVSEAVSSMTIYVEANYTDTVLYWLVPTGTQTWGERTLIGYDRDGSDGWSIQWDFGDRALHDHIYVQALGSDGVSQASRTINVHTLSEGDIAALAQ
ncbi:MAG: hypothetical protein P0Y55_06910 [Candidatus Cohnella colombiensis]|uniref:Uncharacterized protein n=1 Tax=Candidatus Cohnella colombiensis TaxID=3121368 RepID=A0AA95EYD7_9BACL|nr:MAG: hypothetical protein P0Y55_06910 [Cohnella sp.]